MFNERGKLKGLNEPKMFCQNIQKTTFFKSWMNGESENHFPKSPVIQNWVCGFTLIELLMVVFILGMIVSVFVPVSIKSFRGIQLTDSVRNITSQMRYMRDKAILEKEIYSLDFDVKNSCYLTRVKKEDTGKFREAKDLLLSKRKLPNNLKIESIVVKQEDFSNEEKSSICFYPDGSIDEAELVLISPWNEKVMVKTDVSGRINVIEE